MLNLDPPEKRSATMILADNRTIVGAIVDLPDNYDVPSFGAVNKIEAPKLL